MKKMESIKSDVFKKFENDVIIDMSECKGGSIYDTGKGYVYETLCNDYLHTYADGSFQIEYRC